MSRRDDRDRDRHRDRDRDRDHDSRRHRSRLDREPSPKRSRRDGKPVPERVPSNADLDGRGHSDRDQKHRRRLQDALPLEVVAPKVDTVDVGKEPDRKNESKSNGGSDVTKRSSAPTEQDERGNAGQVARNFGRRATTDRSWNESKDRRDERSSKRPTNDAQQKDEKPKARGDDGSVWRHDGFFEMESDPTLPPPPSLPPPPQARKRPAFSEKKTTLESEKTQMEQQNSRPRFPPRPAQEGERRGRDDDRRNFRRPERPFPERRGQASRRDDGFSSRERYGGGNNNNNGRGGDRLGRQDHRSSSSGGTTFAEKWKHDLYDEANKSPPPKNEEDQIAKVEALLAS